MLCFVSCIFTHAKSKCGCGCCCRTASALNVNFLLRNFLCVVFFSCIFTRAKSNGCLCMLPQDRVSFASAVSLRQHAAAAFFEGSGNTLSFAAERWQRQFLRLRQRPPQQIGVCHSGSGCGFHSCSLCGLVAAASAAAAAAADAAAAASDWWQRQ